MKFLVIGDFHGKFTQKQFNQLKKEEFDIILSVGDFCGNDEWGKLFFKHFYAKSKAEIKKISKKIHREMDRLVKLSVVDGLKVLKKLREFGKPLYCVHGNWDPNSGEFDLGSGIRERDKMAKKFEKEFGIDFEFIDFKIKELENFVLVGGASSSSPGKIDKESLKAFFKRREEGDIREVKKEVTLRKKHYFSRQKKFVKSFISAKKSRKPIIFVTHNSPYGTRLDVIRDKKADKRARGKHYGSYLERIMINRFKPELVVCGHIHENFGKQKLGKTLVVNSGATFHNEYVLIDFNEKNKKFKVSLKHLK